MGIECYKDTNTEKRSETRPGDEDPKREVDG